MSSVYDVELYLESKKTGWIPTGIGLSLLLAMVLLICVDKQVSTLEHKHTRAQRLQPGVEASTTRGEADIWKASTPFLTVINHMQSTAVMLVAAQKHFDPQTKDDELLDCDTEGVDPKQIQQAWRTSLQRGQNLSNLSSMKRASRPDTGQSTIVDSRQIAADEWAREDPAPASYLNQNTVAKARKPLDIISNPYEHQASTWITVVFTHAKASKVNAVEWPAQALAHSIMTSVIPSVEPLDPESWTVAFLQSGGTQKARFITAACEGPNFDQRACSVARRFYYRCAVCQTSHSSRRRGA